MSPRGKIKLDFLKTEEVSPHIVDLRKKEKKRIKIKIETDRSIPIFKKLVIVFGLIVLIFVVIVLVREAYFKITNIQEKLIEDVNLAPEIFFSGFDKLNKLQLEAAEKDFQQAGQIFLEKIEQIEESGFFIKTLFNIFPRTKTALVLLDIFNDVSKIGFILARVGQDFDSLFEVSEKKESIEGILPPEIINIDFLEKIEFFKEKSVEVLFLTNKIEKNFYRFRKKEIPSSFYNSFSLISGEVPFLRKSIEDLIVFLNNLEKIVGRDSVKRYLILFQNNNEMRPTGGFLGTYAEIDFQEGKIKNFIMPSGGTYDLAGHLSVSLAPPAPLLIAYPKWQFHDANWFPDWPTSAKKLVWFYERSGGTTVDGVIVINAEFLPQILEIIGEIKISEHEIVINQDNFIIEVQKAIDLERQELAKQEDPRERPEKGPKQILVDLMPLMIKEFLSLDSSHLLEVVKTFNQGLMEKKILFYFNDPQIASFFSDRNLSGEIKKSSLDYLMINVANVNGVKAEEKIEQNIFYNLEINRDGSMIANLTVKRKHGAAYGDLFSGRKELSWLRVYLPQKSLFLGSQASLQKPMPESKFPQDEDVKRIEKEIGFDIFSGTRITEEFGKTCFGNFLEIEPESQDEISFKYLLPFKIDFSESGASYSLMVQKQPGRISNFEAEIILPEGKKIIWAHPQAEIRQEGRTVKISSIIDRDKIFAFVIE